MQPAASPFHSFYSISFECCFTLSVSTKGVKNIYFYYKFQATLFAGGSIMSRIFCIIQCDRLCGTYGDRPDMALNSKFKNRIYAYITNNLS